MDNSKRRFKRSPRRSVGRTATACILVTCFLGWLGVVLFQAIALRGRESINPGLLPGAEPADLRPARAYDFLQHAAAAQQAAPAAECLREHHSLVYVHALRNTMQPVCWPPTDDSTTPEGLASTLLCSYRVIGAAEAHCVGTTLALDLHKLQEALNSSEASQASAALGAPGLLRGNCAMQRGVSTGEARLMAQKLRAHPMLHKFGLVDGDGWFQEGRFGLGGQDWLRRSFEPEAGPSLSKRCVAWVDHPLYFLGGRYDPVNVWHGLEDISHAFESYALMGWGADAQVVVLDALDKGNLWANFTYAPLWVKAFSPHHQPTTLRSLVRSTVQQVEATRGQLPEGAALCFREATWNVHGGVSLMSLGNHQATPCTNSSTVNAMVDFLLHRLGLEAVLPASHAAAANISRMGTPQREHLMQQHRRAVAGRRAAGMRAGGAGAWVLPGLKVVWALRSSRARQQQGILLLLQQELGMQVEAVDLGSMGIEDQIRLMRQTDVLAGYHGAALTLSLFMPPQSALVEVEEEFYRCHCYSNLAAWRNRPYYIISDVSPGRVVDTVKAAAHLVSRRLVERAAGRPSAAPTAKAKAHSEVERQATLALLSLVGVHMELAGGSAPSQEDLKEAVRLMQELMESLGINTHTGLVDWTGMQALAFMEPKDRQLLSRLAWELRGHLVKHGSDDDVARLSGLLSLLSSHPKEDAEQWGALDELEGAG